MIWVDVIDMSKILHVFTWLQDASRKSFFERLTHGAFALGGLVRTVLDPLELELPRFASSNGVSAFSACAPTLCSL